MIRAYRPECERQKPLTDVLAKNNVSEAPSRLGIPPQGQVKMRSRNVHIAFLTSTAIMFFVSGAQAQQQPDPGARGNNVTGSGTTNTIPVWTGTSSIGNSVMFQTGGNLGVGTTTPGSKLDVAGDINFSGSLRNQGTPVLQVLPSSFSLAVGTPITSTTGSGTRPSAS